MFFLVDRPERLIYVLLMKTTTKREQVGRAYMSEDAIRVLRVLQHRDPEGVVVTVRHLSETLELRGPAVVDACDELEQLQMVEWYPGRDTIPGGYALTVAGRAACELVRDL